MPPIDVSLSKIGVQSSVERGPAALPELTVRETTSCSSKPLYLTIYSHRDCATGVFSMVSITNCPIHRRKVPFTDVRSTLQVQGPMHNQAFHSQMRTLSTDLHPFFSGTDVTAFKYSAFVTRTVAVSKFGSVYSFAFPQASSSSGSFKNLCQIITVRKV